jgi:hypothetical protein
VIAKAYIFEGLPGKRHEFRVRDRQEEVGL